MPRRPWLNLGEYRAPMLQGAWPRTPAGAVNLSVSKPAVIQRLQVRAEHREVC